MRMERRRIFRSGGEKRRRGRRSFRQQVAEVREKVGELTRGVAPGTDLRSTAQALEAVEWLEKECGLDRVGAEQVVEHIVAGRAVLGAVPTQTTVIAETIF